LPGALAGEGHELKKEVLIWQANRNAAAIKVNWSFTTEKARDKLKNWYAERTKVTTQNQAVSLLEHLSYTRTLEIRSVLGPPA